MNMPMCAHDQGTIGDPLPASCNACATTVCAADAHCCSTAWDSTCATEAQTMCAVDATQLVNNGELQATVNLTDGSQQTMRLHIKAMRKPAYYVAVPTCHNVCPKYRPDTDPGDCVQVCVDHWVNRPSAGPNYDVDIYQIEYFDAPTSSWLPICTNTDNDGFTNSAIPVPGAWESQVGKNTFSVGDGKGNVIHYSGGGMVPGSEWSAFTFGCRNYGAIAKCVEMGYKPQAYANAKDAAGNAQPLQMEELHKACVRMVRADYCGDGMPHTVDGTSIDVADMMSIQLPDPNDTSAGLHYGPEAEWRSFGAACLSHTRFPDLDPTYVPTSASAPISDTVGDYIAANCPEVSPTGPTVSNCLSSWAPYMAGGTFNEPSFLIDDFNWIAPANILDFSSTIQLN
jgi:hypothetical protein